MARRDENSEHLRTQLDRSRSTYLMMRDAGYDKGTKVKLRFAYRPCVMENALALAQVLRENTRCEVDAMEVEEGWLVKGATRPVKLTAASLGRWVYWMCAAGYKEDCYFDGWGARI